MEELRANTDEIEFYYGTNDLSLVNTRSLDANFNPEKLFEYGNGIYLTDNKLIAKQYAIRKQYKNLAKDNNIVFNNMKQTIYTSGNLHTFKVKIEKLKQNEEYEEITNLVKLKDELKNTIKGYKKNGLDKGYKPCNRYFTYGYIVGQPWDEYWDALFKNKDLKEKNIELSKITIEEIDKLIKRFCKKINFNIKQICIHENSTSSDGNTPELKNLNKEYFSYLNKNLINLNS